jgi:hypothetical protein
MFRELQKEDYARLVVGITSWWLSTLLVADPGARPDPELIDRLAKALIKGSEEVNVSRKIGETGINRFYVRHNAVVSRDDECGFGCWVNVFDRNGNFLTDLTKSLTDHLYQTLKSE